MPACGGAALRRLQGVLLWRAMSIVRSRLMIDQHLSADPPTKRMQPLYDSGNIHDRSPSRPRFGITRESASGGCTSMHHRATRRRFREWTMLRFKPDPNWPLIGTYTARGQVQRKDRPASFLYSLRARSVGDLLGSGVLLPERCNYTLRTSYHSIVDIRTLQPK